MDKPRKQQAIPPVTTPVLGQLPGHYVALFFAEAIALRLARKKKTQGK